jgi:hypothetical protein
MRKWKYDLGASGLTLRDLIQGEETFENSAACINQLKLCCQEIKAHIIDKDCIYAFDDLYELMDGEAEALRDNPTEIFKSGLTDATQLLNARLEEFYDLCDRYSVSVAIEQVINERNHMSVILTVKEAILSF